jgi:hypothetical protein
VSHEYRYWVFRTEKHGRITYWQIEKWPVYAICLNLLIILGILVWWIVKLRNDK